MPQKYKIYSLLAFIFIVVFMQVSKIRLPVAPDAILALRYDLEHGYDVFIFKIVNVVLIYVLFLCTVRLKLGINRVDMLFIFALVAFIIWGIIAGTRGFIIMTTLFLFFIANNNVRVKEVLAKLYHGYFNKSIFTIAGLLIAVLLFYYSYSILVRHYVGSLVSVVSQRFDYLVASYVSLKYIGLEFKLKNVIYPLLQCIPRNVWESKPFPVNAQLTYAVFGYSEKWSVNFGAVGEAMYVFPIVWLIVQSFLLSLCLILFSKIIRKQKWNIYDIAILNLIYGYPMIIVFGGVLNPSTSNIIYGEFLSAFKLIKEG